LSADHPQRAQSFAACVANINALAEPPDMVIHTGDIVHNGTVEEYAAARQILGALQAPVYVIPGNRDRRDVMRETLSGLSPLELPGSFLQYAIDGFGVRILCLDTLSLESNKGRLCEARLEQARELLLRDRETPTAILMHHPPFEVASSRDPFQFETRGCADEFLEMLADAPNIVGLFCGHVHRPSTRMIGQIVATTLTSIALDLRVGHNPPKDDLRPRYDLHVFDPGGCVSTKSLIVERDKTILS